MSSARNQRITVVGAGLVGSLLSILLARRGYQVHVIERRPDPRFGKLVGGRSINLALSDRGLLALDRAGIADDVANVSIPMRGRMVHTLEGNPALLPYGVGDQAIRSVSRGGLNTTLIELAARENNVTLTFARELGEGELAVHDDDRIVIGADGAFSAVRYAMQRRDRFDYSQEYLAHGYKELNIPPGSSLDKNALHIWPRASFMLIALPNVDGSFTCTLFLELDTFATLGQSVGVAREWFGKTFPDALALMPHFEDDWQRNPTSSLVTVRCFPWHVGNTMLIGDAAHAIVPFFGQGMNAGFEDCRVLMEILDDTDDDWSLAMPAFESARKKNADAIAVLALENFVEMRDKVADPVFLAKKKIERRLATLVPDLVTPLYTMVTFSPHIPYAEALRRGRAQERVLDAAVKIPDIDDDALRRMAREALR